MKNTLISLCILGSVVFVSGCVERKPEGPAEMIGKGIDQMAEGFKRIDREEEEKRAKERRHYDDEFSYDKQPSTRDDYLGEPNGDNDELSRDRNQDRRY